MKVVINKRHGGFSLSHAAVMRYAELAGMTLYFESSLVSDMVNYYKVPVEEFKQLVNSGASYSILNPLMFSEGSICRDDPMLVQVVEELGDAANGRYSKLKVVEIPDDIEWIIDDYDGVEWVAERHRTWG